MSYLLQERSVVELGSKGCGAIFQIALKQAQTKSLRHKKEDNYREHSLKTMNGLFLLATSEVSKRALR